MVITILTLFSVFLDDLVRGICAFGLDINVGDVNISSLLCADDIVLVA